MTHSGLLMGMQRFMPSRQLDYILASHADPDIISSLNKWMVTSHCKVMISRLWTRFIPHFTTGKDYPKTAVSPPHVHDLTANWKLAAGRLRRGCA